MKHVIGVFFKVSDADESSPMCCAQYMKMRDDDFDTVFVV